jgi:AraC-like DNA-binding protein
MPLFMDYHQFEQITIEDVKNAHMPDLCVQDKYGVRYHQFWLNKEAGTVFCLMEGPDKEACAAVHREAHGNTACAITEVEPGFYELIMDGSQKVNHSYVRNIDGSLDLGYRNILVASVYGITKAIGSQDFSKLQSPQWARKLILDKIAEYSGQEIKWETNDSLIGVFHDATHVVKCALHIQRELAETKIKEPKIVFKIGLSAAQPVTEKGDFFNNAIKLAHYLSNLAQENQIYISSLVKKLCKDGVLLQDISSVKSLNSPEEEFVLNLFQIAEEKLSDSQFRMDMLSHQIGVSRPQLYRKITTLTGRSPNDFIRDLRLDKALDLLKYKTINIAEIAYETGFNSPSYFTKCFTEKFGCTPSEFARINPA